MGEVNWVHIKFQGDRPIHLKKSSKQHLKSSFTGFHIQAVRQLLRGKSVNGQKKFNLQKISIIRATGSLMVTAWPGRVMYAL